MQRAVLDVVAGHLPQRGLVFAPRHTAEDLGIAPDRLRGGDLADLDTLRGADLAGAVLLHDELSDAGEHAEEVVDTLGAALEPGGVLAATLCNEVFAAATGHALSGRGWSASQARALLHHRGFTVDVICAPGAAARLRGADTFDLAADREPGLLDAAPRLLVIARAPRSPEERSEVFHRTRPRKITAAAVLCRDSAGRVLVVYDRFRGVWTVPGGVVDADEDPASAARREAWEEGGVKVEVGRVLGVFSESWPDRITFMFEAWPTPMVQQPEPVHRHEISQVEWLHLAEALTRLAPDMVYKIDRCLAQPGYCWA